MRERMLVERGMGSWADVVGGVPVELCGQRDRKRRKNIAPRIWHARWEAGVLRRIGRDYGQIRKRRGKLWADGPRWLSLARIQEIPCTVPIV